MSSVSEERRKRQQNVKEGLQLIQSPLSYPGTQEKYAVCLRALVRNLFNEGHDAYGECDWNSSYAKSEEILIPKEIIEKLHINHIACYSNMGFHDKCLEDCDTVLSLNASNCKALYQKSKALSDLGRYKEAYDAVAKKLTQELAQKLGFKIRKAYVRAELSLKAAPGNGATKNEALNCSVEDIEPDLLTPRQEAVPIVSIPASSFSHQVERELASVPIKLFSSILPLQVEESSLPSTVLANGRKIPFTMPEAFLNDGDVVLGDEIDDLLDSSPETNEAVMPSALVRGPLPTATVSPSIPFSVSLLGTLPIGARYAPPPSVSALYPPLSSSLEDFCSSLNSFSMSESKRDLCLDTGAERGLQSRGLLWWQ
uniref:Zinc finger CCCH-type containing 7A n=1 Tax=Equus asinus TaxID=9793 RepID=A0A8C4PFU1_EQUAS